jgi:hypothetical protein
MYQALKTEKRTHTEKSHPHAAYILAEGQTDYKQGKQLQNVVSAIKRIKQGQESEQGETR